MSTTITPSVARKWLTSFAHGVGRRLADYELVTYTPAKHLAVTRAPYTDGWCARIGDIDVIGAEEVSVFLDNSPGDGQYHAWVGFFVNTDAQVNAMSRHLEKHVGKPFVLPDAAFVERGKHTFMKAPLPKARYGRPVVEKFSGNLKDLGLFLPGSIDFSSNPPSKSIAMASTFLAECFGALEDWAAPSGKRETPGDVPNTDGWVSSHVFRRSPALAKAAKERDRYTCRVCGDRPTQKYGNADGRACLDAHHVQALHTRRAKSTGLKDLVTVCANCHRVLGRLTPDRRGLKQLQVRFRS